MIQDIAPHKYDNSYNPVPPDRDSIACLLYTSFGRKAVRISELPGQADWCGYDIQGGGCTDSGE